MVIFGFVRSQGRVFKAGPPSTLLKDLLMENICGVCDQKIDEGESCIGRADGREMTVTHICRSCTKQLYKFMQDNLTQIQTM